MRLCRTARTGVNEIRAPFAQAARKRQPFDIQSSEVPQIVAFIDDPDRENAAAQWRENLAKELAGAA
jgi:hypothetical protein